MCCTQCCATLLLGMASTSDGTTRVRQGAPTRSVFGTASFLTSLGVPLQLSMNDHELILFYALRRPYVCPTKPQNKKRRCLSRTRHSLCAATTWREFIFACSPATEHEAREDDLAAAPSKCTTCHVSFHCSLTDHGVPRGGAWCSHQGRPLPRKLAPGQCHLLISASRH